MILTRPGVSCVAPLAGLLLAACGGSNVNQVAAAGPAPALPSTGGVAPAVTPAPPPDPALPFRLAYADPGGMWMPQQMTLPQHANNFKSMGVTLDAEKLSDPLASPLAAVVSLGGCTGSFVSPEGLVVTNHHCVQGSLQRNSDEKHNLVEDGFLARTKADEKPAGPAQRVMVAQAFKDVTKEMRDGLDAIKDPIARKEALEKRSKQLIAACEKDRPEIRCSVSKFFRGGLYELIEMLEIKDVRLVYVPARSVGDYGGEVDNWEWPRHTGDWSFYRAYVGKDGKPADPSPDNVPYQPKNWLKVSTAGLRPGDFVMVAGYPARTERGETASETHNDLDWYYPYVTAYLDERYKVAEAHAQDAGETGIKATTTKQSVQNGLEKYQGIAQAFQKHPDLLEQKDAVDRQTKAWAAQPGREKYKKDIDQLEAILADARKTQRVDFDRNAAFGASRLLGTAVSLTRWAEERAKKDEDRKPGYQARDLDRATAVQKQFARSFDRTLDRAELRLGLVHALRLPEAQRPWLASLLGSKPGQKVDEKLIDATLDAWYAAPPLEDAKLRLDLLANGTMKDLRASKDPFLAAALRIWPIVKAEEKKTDARAGELLLVEPSYVEAMKQALGGAVAPDANSTLRVTYGTVRSLHPEARDLENGPFTVASQILAKDTGKEPFNAPSKLLEAIKAKDFGPYADPALGGDLPIDFEADMDITGGNSGSPTLNAKGELVGLAFDGNKEGIASDVVFDPKTTRSIHVDARYMIWTMDKLDDAKHLIKEMGLTPKM